MLKVATMEAVAASPFFWFGTAASVTVGTTEFLVHETLGAGGVTTSGVPAISVTTPLSSSL